VFTDAPARSWSFVLAHIDGNPDTNFHHFDLTRSFTLCLGENFVILMKVYIPLHCSEIKSTVFTQGGPQTQIGVGSRWELSHELRNATIPTGKPLACCQRKCLCPVFNFIFLAPNGVSTSASSFGSGNGVAF
jgi:hypothetical protein